jgi:hypothetical protein
MASRRSDRRWTNSTSVAAGSSGSSSQRSIILARRIEPIIIKSTSYPWKSCATSDAVAIAGWSACKIASAQTCASTALTNALRSLIASIDMESELHHAASLSSELAPAAAPTMEVDRDHRGGVRRLWR